MAIALAQKELTDGPSAPSEIRTLRIAIVIPTHWGYRMGGSQYQARFIVDGLAERGVENIAWFAARIPSGFSSPTHRVIPTGRARRARRFGHFWDAYSLYKALDEFRPDVIYQRVRCSHTGIVARYALAKGIPMIWHAAHDRDCAGRRSTLKRLSRPHETIEELSGEYGIRNASCRIAQTRTQARLLEENYGLSSREVIYNFHPAPERLPDKALKTRVLWIANLKPAKRPELMLDIAEELKSSGDIEIRMMGAPWQNTVRQQHFLKRVETLSNVQYLGTVPQEQVNEELGRAHILVNTSTAEGFSNTFIQAWMRRVVVLTMGVNPDGLLDAGVLGRALTSVDDVAKAIRHFDAHRDELRRMGDECRSTSTRLFSMDNRELLLDLIISAGRAARETRTDSGTAGREHG